jgi:MSHA biogenesis protein MshO
MVLVAIIVGGTIYFLYPLRQAVDLTVRAELTDIADNALQRIGREVRLALPNSVRRDASGLFLEFIPVRAAGRYRAESSGTACDVGTDELSFDSADTCFKSIGKMANAATITSNDFLVLNNFGPGFTGQNAYATSGSFNSRKIAAAVDEGARERITFSSFTFIRTLHDSPGKRFYVVNGNGTTPEPVTYECDLAHGRIFRRWGYTMVETPQPTSFTNGTSALIAENVSGCSFDYVANVASQVGLLTLRLTLSKTLSGGGNETVSLYHAVHVTNVP